ASPAIRAVRASGRTTAFAGARRWRPVALAASLAAVAFIAAELHTPDSYRTGVGEQRTVSLPDGSEVVLDTDTSLRVVFSEGARRVELAQGQALFQVAKDASRPFTVVAGVGSVTALGTQFVVRRDPAEMIVTLLEGSVEIVQAPVAQASPGVAPPEVEAPPVQHVVLRPGQQVRGSKAGLARIEAPRLDEATAWQSGRLIFADQPLDQVVDEINRYARRHKLRLGDPALRGLRVSGVFDAGHTESFADALAVSLGLRIVAGRDGETVLLPRQAAAK
ncbi:MAG: putative FecR, iron siderophore sensor protein, partial [Rhodospirillales bacterium]|nr:putative FecR, iron siderophore sensor protein [Rhodospirillales bacterium]